MLLNKPLFSIFCSAKIQQKVQTDSLKTQKNDIKHIFFMFYHDFRILRCYPSRQIISYIFIVLFHNQPNIYRKNVLFGMLSVIGMLQL